MPSSKDRTVFGRHADAGRQRRLLGLRRPAASAADPDTARRVPLDERRVAAADTRQSCWLGSAARAPGRAAARSGFCAPTRPSTCLACGRSSLMRSTPQAPSAASAWRPAPGRLRRRQGEPISTALVERAVNEIVTKHMNKKQQMRWNRKTVQPFLGVRRATEKQKAKARAKTPRPRQAPTGVDIPDEPKPDRQPKVQLISPSHTPISPLARKRS